MLVDENRKKRERERERGEKNRNRDHFEESRMKYSNEETA